MPSVTLVAIDASPQAEAAFQWYLDHIHRDGNSIVILHSVDLTVLSEQDDVASSSDLLWSKQKGQIKSLEDKYRWKLNEKGLAGKIRTESGKPGEVIIRVSQQEKTSLIVIGSRGLSKLKRTIQGSVSDYVLHHAHCPVIVWRQQEPRGSSFERTSSVRSTASTSAPPPVQYSGTRRVSAPIARR
ncbi:hypothetical protein CAPTEDRAFT_163750 [Capitella teleta]|uniref:UspA domain-containing protein n=1 Tax=Capitella teleta TaxID=283909 RepID=R7TK87_CAPTE|nr:hypothetical protein CAPTEDRAFT_163750 [Capitella teleta]|eukprot:ELT94124.1 hypothetical protein CAPTEDRAFT_163750 [Capitella teleta]